MKIGNKIKLRNGNAGTIVYESPFGKLLIVEHNGDELPLATGIMRMVRFMQIVQVI